MSRRQFAPDVLSIETPALSLSCHRDPMDEETFHAPIASIAQIELKQVANAALDYRRFADWCVAERIMLCSTHIRQDRGIAECMFLQERGFRFIELNYRVSIDNLGTLVLPESEVTIADAPNASREELAAMAERMFQFGRYHQDPRVYRAAADRRYQHWLERAFGNPAQQVLQCSYGGRTIGFVVVETPIPERRDWSLIGLAPEYTGKGLGRQTWIAVLRRHAAEGVDKVATSISSHNVPVANLYASLEFRFSEPKITLHWCPPGAPLLGL